MSTRRYGVPGAVPGAPAGGVLTLLSIHFVFPRYNPVLLWKRLGKGSSFVLLSMHEVCFGKLLMNVGEGIRMMVRHLI